MYASLATERKEHVESISLVEGGQLSSYLKKIFFLPQQSCPTPKLVLVVRCQDSKRFRYLFSVTPPDNYSTRPLLRWVRSQGRSPHAFWHCQNTFGPICIPLIRSASGARQLTQPPLKAYGDGPLRPEEDPMLRHTRQDLHRSNHAQPKCNPTEGVK